MVNIKDDNFFMNLAINIAKRNIGMTGTNPSVGCVLVSSENKILSTGCTGKGGSPHAEYDAINKSKNLKHSILYTTLEPCSHSGKNPPCVDYIISSGVSKVVISSKDINPLVNGKSIKKLKQSKIEVTCGVLKEETELLYSGFFNRMKFNKPIFDIKIASSADGKTALKTGKSKWITNQLSRNYGHRLRSINDGIMVGINTVLIDNPSLTCRLPGLEGFSPTRIVLDTNLRIPHESNIVKTANKYKTFIFTSKESSKKKISNLNKKGIKVFHVPKTKKGLSFSRILYSLGELGFNNILVEGGNKLIASAITSSDLNRIYWFSSEKIIGEEGLPSVGSLNISNLENSPNIEFHNMINLNNNYLKIFKAIS